MCTFVHGESITLVHIDSLAFPSLTSYKFSTNLYKYIYIYNRSIRVQEH